MDPFISQNITFLKSLPTEFPQSRFNYNRNKMGRSSCSLQERMTPRRDPRRPSRVRLVYAPFDADDLSRCLWWIIDNPVYWRKENFLSVTTASPEWKGIIIWLIPLIQELMMTATREEPELSQWIRQIMNDSIDPPPHQNMEEATELVAALKSQHELNPTLLCSSLKIRQQDSILSESSPIHQIQFWEHFQTKPQKLTNDLITLASRDTGEIRIVSSKNKNESQVLLEQNNRWITKITYPPIILTVVYYGENE